jgi:CRISPR-associated protein Csx16
MTNGADALEPTVLLRPSGGQTIFVTRHSGARDWLRRRGIDAMLVDHLAPAAIASLGPDDSVIGTLPVNLIADVNRRGARYLHCVIDIPEALRGKDLSADDMERLNARLEPYHAVVVAPAPRAGPPPPAAAGGIRRWLWRRRYVATGVALTVAIFLLGSWGPQFWYDAIVGESAAGRQNLFLWGLAALAGLAVCVWVLYRLRNRFFQFETRSVHDHVEPRRVLIVGLSELKNPSEADGFMTLVRDKGLSLDWLGCPSETFRERLRSLGVATDEIDRFDRFPWLTGLVSIGAHAPRLETVIVVPSPKSSGQVELFRSLVEVAWANTAALHGRPLSVYPVAAVDYDQFDAVCKRLEATMKEMTVLDMSEVCFDATAGTKVYSAATAAMTLNNDAICMYVTSSRHFEVFDTRLALAEGMEV